MKINSIIRTLSIFVLLFINLKPTFSQNNLSGYIIQLNGDTVKGFINYRNWEKNPNTISFQKIAGEAATTYDPLEIMGFGVKDEQYRSAIVEIETSPLEGNQIQSPTETMIGMDTTFLQTMFAGEKSLYHYKNSINRDYFYIGKGEGVELLIYKKYLSTKDGRQVLTENKKYLGQLALYLQGTEGIDKKLKSTRYTKKDLDNLFSYYYNQTHATAGFRKETEKALKEFGVLAGVCKTNLTFESDLDYFDYLVKGNPSHPTGFTGGVFMDIVLPRGYRKWSFNNELIFTSYKLDTDYKDIKNSNQSTYTKATVGMAHIKMNNMVRYKYPIKGLFIYVNVGIATGYGISEENKRHQESVNYGTETVTDDKAIDSMRPFELGYLYGAGIKVGRLSFEIRGDTHLTGISQGSGLAEKFKRQYFLLGYRF